MAGTPAQNGNNAAGNNDSSRKTVALATGWPSPTTPSGGQTFPDGTSATGQTPDGRKVQVTLGLVADQAGWPTSSAMDTGNTGTAWIARRERVKAELKNGNGFGLILHTAAQLAGPARLTASGEMLIGSHAGMESGGQLSPAHSLWLMLGPIATVWASCGERVTRLTSRKRKGS